MTTFPSAVLVVLDGWGLAPDGPGNAISLADTPVFDDLHARYATTTMVAKGPAVGLPEGQMGNSEVGHLNLGAGSVVKQDLLRIDEAVASGALAENAVLREGLTAAPRVHLIGLVSSGGVHSADRHLDALVRLAAELGVEDLVVHAFTDGRDTSPTAGAGSLAELERTMAEAGTGRVGSVIGRYFAMDRDERWERTDKAVALMVDGEGDHHADSGEAAVRAAYDRDETDEFITATTVGEEARIRPQDAVVAFNFRPDRMRQLTSRLSDRVARYTCLAEYDERWDLPVAFPPERPSETIAHVIAAGGHGQLHVAETEKYPHVTYFFNGGEERPYEGERREVAPSPRDVATYDLAPAMSAQAAADRFVEAWREDGPQFGVINFANADMVGHTGVIPAAVEAVETVDAQLARIVEVVQDSGGVLLITADHGNADHMLEPDGSPNTAHSLNPVPVIVTAEGVELREGGTLCDVAPTLLQLLGIEQPAAMTGRSLIA